MIEHRSSILSSITSYTFKIHIFIYIQSYRILGPKTYYSYTSLMLDTYLIHNAEVKRMREHEASADPPKFYV